MIFITLVKFRKKPTKETIAQNTKITEAAMKKGVKVIATYWTLGRYDAIRIAEAKDVKTAMETIMKFGDNVATETMVAMTREDAIKLL